MWNRFVNWLKSLFSPSTPAVEITRVEAPAPLPVEPVGRPVGGPIAVVPEPQVVAPRREFYGADGVPPQDATMDEIRDLLAYQRYLDAYHVFPANHTDAAVAVITAQANQMSAGTVIVDANPHTGGSSRPKHENAYSFGQFGLDKEAFENLGERFQRAVFIRDHKDFTNYAINTGYLSRDDVNYKYGLSGGAPYVG